MQHNLAYQRKSIILTSAYGSSIFCYKLTEYICADIFQRKAVTDCWSQQAGWRKTVWGINTLCMISKLTNSTHCLHMVLSLSMCVCLPCCSSTLLAAPGLFGIVSIGNHRGRPGRRQMAGVHTWYSQIGINQ